MSVTGGGGATGGGRWSGLENYRMVPPAPEYHSDRSDGLLSQQRNPLTSAAAASGMTTRYSSQHRQTENERTAGAAAGSSGIIQQDTSMVGGGAQSAVGQYAVSSLQQQQRQQDLINGPQQAPQMDGFQELDQASITVSDNILARLADNLPQTKWCALAKNYLCLSATQLEDCLSTCAPGHTWPGKYRALSLWRDKLGPYNATLDKLLKTLQEAESDKVISKGVFEFIDEDRKRSKEVAKELRAKRERLQPLVISHPFIDGHCTDGDNRISWLHINGPHKHDPLDIGVKDLRVTKHWFFILTENRLHIISQLKGEVLDHGQTEAIDYCDNQVYVNKAGRITVFNEQDLVRRFEIDPGIQSQFIALNREGELFLAWMVGDIRVKRKNQNSVQPFNVHCSNNYEIPELRRIGDIIVQKKRGKVIVSDIDHRQLFLFNNSGEPLKTYKGDLKCNLGMCTDFTENIIVTDHIANNVILLTSELDFKKILLREADGVVQPRAAAVDPDGFLWVSCEKYSIRKFQINYGRTKGQSAMARTPGGRIGAPLS